MRSVVVDRSKFCGLGVLESSVFKGFRGLFLIVRVFLIVICLVISFLVLWFFLLFLGILILIGMFVIVILI